MTALEMNSLGDPRAQIDGNDLVRSLSLAIQKWQTHIERLFSRRGAKGVIAHSDNGYCRFQGALNASV